MQCARCNNMAVKNGKSKKGIQRFYCRACKKGFQNHYVNKACEKDITEKIAMLTRESCGVRSIARILKISCTTVIKRTKNFANSVRRPFEILMSKEYEVDEMRTFIGNKKSLYWIVYALRKDTKEVIDFKVGKRTKETLQNVVDTLLLSHAKEVHTDGYWLYQSLIPPEVHRQKKYNINRIERKNLSIRTHLKRLSRKTICFSKSKEMLEACLKIYFWSGKKSLCVIR